MSEVTPTPAEPEKRETDFKVSLAEVVEFNKAREAEKATEPKVFSVTAEDTIKPRSA